FSLGVSPGKLCWYQTSCSLRFCQNLLGNRLHQSLGFGIGCKRTVPVSIDRAWHATSHTGTPFVVVAEFAFFETVTRVGDAEALFDLEQVLELRRRHGLRRPAKLRGY